MAQLAWALSAADWRQQSIYQVMTDRFARTDLSTTATCNTEDAVYCGGTYQGLISKLDYIQGMGFTAIWISPIVKQMDGNTGDGSSYHGYWAQDIWSLNPSFGTAADLTALSAALHARGMYLMLDVVTNHFAYNGCGTCVDYSIFNPFNEQSYFHPFCLIDYSNQTSIEQCWEGDNTVALPDLRTEDSDVRAIWNDWIATMVSTYGIDGLRVDSVKHQETSFWPGFGSAAGVFMLGEVYNGDPAELAAYQDDGMPGLLDYASYYWITAAFESSSGSISTLADGINTLKSVATDTSLYGSFLENHDQPRFASLTSDVALAKNAIAFTMLKDGIPVIYQGQEQHYAGGAVPADREAIWLSGYSTSATLYTWIAALNELRARAIAQDSSYLTYQAWPVYSDSQNIAMRKGSDGYQVIGVYTNKGASGSSTLTLTTSMTGFTASESVVDVMSCTTFTTDSSGSLAVTLSGGIPRVFYPSARLSGSGICGTTTTSVASTSSTATTKSSTTLVTSCTATAVAITFNELASTTYGQTVKLTGNITALGSWDTANAIALSASQYTTSNPLWSGTVSLAPGVGVLFKFIKVDGSGTVTWEADPNHTYTVPCAAATVSASWQT
ncbi:glycoside hydrolase family 13 protein [Coniochaeta ligniaria NRRL 30616]|uniref:alpha-amylase n=1 Tax=Coniochaeta ligniaria NRRL 30616 TaxID=1408157 RepID=A0A1J7J3L7_9PEZI|nr:glycoside hydrolase family 13 protein [Coniochaeta ligniaria NRRL 30616]